MHKSSGVAIDVSSPQHIHPFSFLTLDIFKAAGSALLGISFSSSEVRLNLGTYSSDRLSSSPSHSHKATSVSRYPLSRASMRVRPLSIVISPTKDDNKPRTIGAIVSIIVGLVLLGVIIGLLRAGLLQKCCCRRRRSSEDREGQA